MLDTVFVGVDELCTYVGGQLGIAHRLAFREVDPAAPAARNAEAERLSRGELEKVFADWRQGNQHLAERERLRSLQELTGEEIAVARRRAVDLDEGIGRLLATGRNPAEAEAKLADAQRQIGILEDRQTKLDRLVADAHQKALADLRNALLARQAELAAALAADYREALARMERAVSDTLPAVLVAMNAGFALAMGARHNEVSLVDQLLESAQAEAA